MPPMILWALGVVGVAVVGRWLVRESRRVNDELHPADPAAAERRAAQNLKRDPDTGVYRPS